jgi:hypothetical protein
MLMDTVQNPRMRLYFSRNKLLATPVRFRHFVGQIWMHLYSPEFYRQNLQGHIWMTTTSGQNLSYNQTPTFNIPEFVPTPTQFRLLVANVVEGPPILQTIPSTEIITVQNKDIQIVRITFCLSVVLHSLYWKGNRLDSPLFFSKNMPKATAIILNLSEPLCHRGYTLWMDNYYNFSSSGQILKLCNHRLCRHCRVNRKAVPKKLQESKLQKGDAILQHSRHVHVLWWGDKKHVTMTSTYHAA